jgi:hypothetical protein
LKQNETKRSSPLILTIATFLLAGAGQEAGQADEVDESIPQSEQARRQKNLPPKIRTKPDRSDR